MAGRGSQRQKEEKKGRSRKNKKNEEEEKAQNILSFPLNPSQWPVIRPAVCMSLSELLFSVPFVCKKEKIARI